MDSLLNQYLVFGYENLVKRFRLEHTMCVCSMRNFNEEYRDLFNGHNDVILECALDDVSCDKDYEDVLIHGIPRNNIKREYSKNVTITKYTDEEVHYIIDGDETYHKTKRSDLKDTRRRIS